LHSKNKKTKAHTDGYNIAADRIVQLELERGITANRIARFEIENYLLADRIGCSGRMQWTGKPM